MTNMRRFASDALAAMVSLVLTCGGADAAPIFSQVAGGGTFEGYISSTQRFDGTPGQRVADDFRIAAGGTVSTVEWWGDGSGTSFEVTFYADGGGHPGAALLTVPVTPVSHDVIINKGFGSGTYYLADISTPFIADPGTKYWISIFDGAPGGRWEWLNATANLQFARQAENGTSNWTSGPRNVSFQLSDDTTAEIPEPGTLLLLSAGLGVALAGRRRKRSPIKAEFA